jgi:hypothetical protein
MKSHRNPHTSIPKPADYLLPAPDLAESIHRLRDCLGKADAYITAAERLLELPGGADGGDGEPGNRRNHAAHLIESARMAVRSAAHVTEEIDRCRRDA